MLCLHNLASIQQVNCQQWVGSRLLIDLICKPIPSGGGSDLHLNLKPGPNFLSSEFLTMRQSDALFPKVLTIRAWPDVWMIRSKIRGSDARIFSSLVPTISLTCIFPQVLTIQAWCDVRMIGSKGR